MVQYKLIYFDLRGAGEAIRMLFHYAKEKFEDFRVEQAKWEKLKPKMPFGKLPVLEVDGKQLPESYAICRYLARKHGLAGKDAWEEATVDAYADMVKDCGAEMMSYFRVAAGMAEGDKDKLKKEVFQPAADKYFPLLEKHLSKSKSGFIVPSGVTWADFLIAERLVNTDVAAPGCLKAYPALQKYIEKVHAVPQIKEYVKSRPKTKF
ncbi:Nagst-1 protein [Aphelenchoides avenae]|nr:Nagst-1 protein [Aphelenchus avenae]